MPPSLLSIIMKLSVLANVIGRDGVFLPCVKRIAVSGGQASWRTVWYWGAVLLGRHGLGRMCPSIWGTILSRRHCTVVHDGMGQAWVSGYAMA